VAGLGCCASTDARPLVGNETAIVASRLIAQTNDAVRRSVDRVVDAIPKRMGITSLNCQSACSKTRTSVSIFVRIEVKRMFVSGVMSLVCGFAASRAESLRLSVKPATLLAAMPLRPSLSLSSKGEWKAGGFPHGRRRSRESIAQRWNLTSKTNY